MSIKKVSTKDVTDKDGLLEFAEVAGTPFRIAKEVRDDGVGGHLWTVLMGNYRMNSVAFESEKEAIVLATTVSWDTVMQVITVMIIEQDKLIKDE